MIFLRYEKFGQYIRWYRITSILLLINLLFYATVLILGRDSEFYINTILIHVPPYSGELWRVVTAMFLHGDFSHLLFNMFALFVFAPPLEYLLGRVKYAVLYLGAGIFGNFVSLYFSTAQASLGASGAIYGIFGAYVYLVLFHRSILDEASRKTITMLLVMGLIYTLLIPNISVSAHLGGLAGGFLLFSSLFQKKPR